MAAYLMTQNALNIDFFFFFVLLTALLLTGAWGRQEIMEEKSEYFKIIFSYSKQG